jgi:hypothetical protein
MATLSEVGPGSFAEYEGIRIVIPGLLTYGIAVGTFQTVAPSEKATIFESPVAGIVASLTIGLLLYFLDVPARSAAFYKNQPTDYLKVEFPDIKSGELLTAYLLLLNTRMPSNTRNRALYTGSMYRIGLEMILVAAMAISVVFGASLLEYGPDRGAVSLEAHRIAAASLVVVFVLALWASAAYGPATVRQRLSSFSRGFLARSMIAYIIGIVFIVLPVLLAHFDKLPALQHRVVAVLGLAISIAYWNWRYVRGDKPTGESGSRRDPLDSPFAGFSFLLPIIIVLSLYTPASRNILPSVGYLVGWTAATALVITMVVIRGHERKLHGVYRGQTRWLQDNRKEVSEFLGITTQDPQEGSDPVRVEVAIANVQLTAPPYRLGRWLAPFKH